MKRLIYLLLFCLPLTAAAQTIAVEAIVMDAQTQEPLPYASIYISNTNSTITNAEGGFRIVCEAEDKIRLSFVGYKTKYILATEMTPVVELEPMATTLSEVTVLPIRSLLE